MYLQYIKETKRRILEKQETISYPSLDYQTKESHTNPIIVIVTKLHGMFPTNNEEMTTELTLRTNEKHKECSRASDSNVGTQEDSLLSIAARDDKGFEH